MSSNVSASVVGRLSAPRLLPSIAKCRLSAIRLTFKSRNISVLGRYECWGCPSRLNNRAMADGLPWAAIIQRPGLARLEYGFAASRPGLGLAAGSRPRPALLHHRAIGAAACRHGTNA